MGNIIIFKCNAGYQLVGPQKRVCAANAQWSGVQPTCRGKAVYPFFLRLRLILNSKYSLSVSCLLFIVYCLLFCLPKIKQIK